MVIGARKAGEKKWSRKAKFLENNKLKTLIDRTQNPEAQWTWTRKNKENARFWIM